MWSTGINRNIVECKAKRTTAMQESILVLIETLWNVKKGNRVTQVTFDSVLIETLWNVKQRYISVYLPVH